MAANNKKALWAIIILLLLVSVGYFYYDRYHNRYVSKQFDGRIVKFENDTLLLDGQYVMGGNDALPPSASLLNRVSVKFPAGTEFIKTVVHMPVPLGSFYTNDLKKDVTKVGLDQFKNDISDRYITITVKSEKNIYNRPEFEASEVSYSISQYDF